MTIYRFYIEEKVDIFVWYLYILIHWSTSFIDFKSYYDVSKYSSRRTSFSILLTASFSACNYEGFFTSLILNSEELFFSSDELIDRVYKGAYFVRIINLCCFPLYMNSASIFFFRIISFKLQLQLNLSSMRSSLRLIKLKRISSFLSTLVKWINDFSFLSSSWVNY